MKDVAERFDVTMQTVYKWINEGKVKYEEINSPGKQQRKGCRIPAQQFEGKMQLTIP
jgi:transposase